MTETKKIKERKKAITRLLIFVGIVVLVNVLSSSFFTRFDLTADKRFTLADSTKQMLRNLDDVVFVKVYLQGEMPAGFKRLSNSTKEMLDEFKAYGGDKIQYQFEDPSAGKSEDELKQVWKDLGEKGLQPTNVQNKTTDQYSQQIVVPGALVNYKGKEAPVNLLENMPGVGAQIVLNNSIAHLENSFTTTIEELKFAKAPKIGFVHGEGELKDYDIADLTTELSSFYDLEVINLPDELTIPQEYKLIVVARPTQPFDEKDKFKIDQYIMNGGKVLWLVEALNVDMDSVRKKYVTTDFQLNLDDQLFKYGVRINPALLMDLQCNPVPLVTGFSGGQPNISTFPCPYFPVFRPSGNFPILKNIDAVNARFSGTLDTIGVKGIKKTVLLHSSLQSQQVYTPWLIDFSELRNRPDEREYSKKNILTGVLLEGKFPSVFQNRLAAKTLEALNDSLKMTFKDESIPTKMIVLSDGDIMRNELTPQGQPYPLGYNHWTNSFAANKPFMLNCIDYLAGFDQNIITRSKTVQLRLLNTNLVKKEKLQWQLINMLAPLGVLLVLSAIFIFVRRRMFAQ